MSETILPKLVPLLVVRGAAGAINFHVQALGARETVRYLDKSRLSISHADLAIGEVALSVTEEARAWNSDAPRFLAALEENAGLLGSSGPHWTHAPRRARLLRLL